MAKKKMDDTKPRMCMICRRKFVGKPALINHMGKTHESNIPDGWSASRYENFLRTGKTEGRCVECGKPTDWNESTWKYHRLCKNPKCRENNAKHAKENMVRVHKKEHLLDDPNMQKKMIYAKRTSGTYYFEDPDDPTIKYPTMYDSSFAKDFLEMLDAFNFNGRDILAPSPNVYTYEYDGKPHFYIPDVYIISLNLEVELKDGGDNPNKHPKIQKVDKEKERLKDEVMDKLSDQVNYIKICNKDYSGFFALLSQLKAEDHIVYMPKWREPSDTVMHESTVSFINDYKKQLNYAKNVTVPVLSYADVVLELEKDVKKIKTENDYRKMETMIGELRHHLVYVANNSNTEENTRLNFEAKRAIKTVDTVLMPALDLKRKTFAKSKMKSVSEAAIADLLNPAKYQPVYVVLFHTGSKTATIIKEVTHDAWSHATITFDESLTQMYSFNSHGFIVENIYESIYAKQPHKIPVSVYALMVSVDIKDQMQKFIEQMVATKDIFQYNIKGMLSFVTGWSGDNVETKKFCSQFVSEILTMANENIIDRPAYKIKPVDLSTNENLHHIYTGKLSNYNPKRVRACLLEKIKLGVFDDD